MCRSPKISVVIPTCNRVEILKKCLVHLENQIIPKNLFEVLVIDDASEDQTVNFLLGYTPEYLFRYYVQTKNSGPAAARNVGVLAARGDIIVFINDDTLLDQNALAVHLIVHQNLIDLDVSVLGRFDLPSFFTKSIWGYTLQNSDLLFRYPPMKNNSIYSYKHYWTCNISTSRKAILEAGLFSEQFCGNAWGAEDQELGKRLFDRGVPVLFREDCRSTHQHALTVDGFIRMSIIRGGGGVLLFFKHKMKPHYSRIREEDIRFWRNLPTCLVERMEQFKRVISAVGKKTPKKNLVHNPYLYKESYPEVHDTCFRLWSIRTKELIKLIEFFESQIIHLNNRLNKNDIFIEEASSTYYPSLLFLRFYYDTIGICDVDEIRKFCSNI